MTHVVILVRPADPRNIGAAARACANFGVRHLRIVQDDPLNERDLAPIAVASCGALEYLEPIRAFRHLNNATADCHIAVALCGKQVAERLTLFDPTGPLATDNSSPPNKRSSALVFGPETSGLSRSDTADCTHVWHLPTQHHFPSLNLGQAVAVALALLQSAASPALTASAGSSESKLRTNLGQQREALASRLSALLPRIGIPETDRLRMQHELQRLLARSHPSPEDLAMLLTLLRKIEHTSPPHNAIP